MTLLSKTTKMLIPNKIIVTYKASGDRPGAIYVEHGTFVKTKTGYSPTGMTPMSEMDMREFISLAKAPKGIYADGILPKNLIYYNNNGLSSKVIWIASAAKRKISFHDKELTREYQIPNVLFVANNTDLSVYLVKKSNAENITEDTLLYQTHFLNVYENCKVCIGSGYRPNMDSTPLSEFIKKAEFNFFEGSTFNLSHVGDWVWDIWRKNNGSFPEKLWNKKKAIKLKSLL